jgi:hypothetical protein
MSEGDICMYTIYKHPIKLQDSLDIRLPAEARILGMGSEKGFVFLWVLADPVCANETRHFRLVGTGHPAEDAEVSSLHHVGTFGEGPLVFHLFEVIKK